jgi:hypothetical protein
LASSATKNRNLLVPACLEEWLSFQILLSR